MPFSLWALLVVVVRVMKTVCRMSARRNPAINCMLWTTCTLWTNHTLWTICRALYNSISHRSESQSSSPCRNPLMVYRLCGLRKQLVTSFTERQSEKEKDQKNDWAVEIKTQYFYKEYWSGHYMGTGVFALYPNIYKICHNKTFQAFSIRVNAKKETEKNSHKQVWCFSSLFWCCISKIIIIIINRQKTTT